ncbi:unnamed protein product, partial [Prorocentrum cordatum]
RKPCLAVFGSAHHASACQGGTAAHGHDGQLQEEGGAEEGRQQPRRRGSSGSSSSGSPQRPRPRQHMQRRPEEAGSWPAQGGGAEEQGSGLLEVTVRTRIDEARRQQEVARERQEELDRVAQLLTGWRGGGRDGERRVLDEQGEAVEEQGSGLLEAVKRRDQEAVVSLCCLRRGLDLEEADDGGRTPLIVASSLGLKEAVKALIGARANVNAASDSATTPLMAASHSGTAEASQIARLLCAARAAADQRDGAGLTPLMLAAHKGRAEVADVICGVSAHIERTGHGGLDGAVRRRAPGPRRRGPLPPGPGGRPGARQPRR